MIIAISGKKRSGKDTIAEFLVKKYNFTRYAFADPIKSGCKELMGFTDEQLWGDKKEVTDKHWGVTPRKVLQVLGTEVFQQVMPRFIPELRKIGNYFWPHRFLLWYKQNKDGLGQRVVIPDLRFPQELSFLRKLGTEVPIFVIKILRDTGKKRDVHASELGVDQINNVDAMIENNSTISSLYKKVDMKVKNFIENSQD